MKMPRFFWAIVAISLTTVLAAGTNILPANAEPEKVLIDDRWQTPNYIIPAISVGGDTTVRLEGKFAMGKYFSLRPFYGIRPGGKGDAGMSLAIDIYPIDNPAIQSFVGFGLENNNSPSRPFIPRPPQPDDFFFGPPKDPALNGGLSSFVEIGSDFLVGRDAVINARVHVPLSDRRQETAVTIGAGFHF
jgi:hypothetical protein